MRGLLIGLSVSVAFIGGCVAGSRDIGVPDAKAGSGNEVIEQRWTYFCFDGTNAEDVAYKANAAGARGWEMVASAPGDRGRSVWCFRQPRP